MKFWVFRIAVSEYISSKESEKDGFSYKFIQGKRFAGNEGDRVVFLFNDPKIKDWRFSHVGIIKNINSDFKEGQVGQRINYSLQFGELQIIKEPYKLSDFSYTLLRNFNNYDEPILRFRGLYNKILDWEFVAIIYSQIFVARTAFGKIVNALHREQRIDFTKYIISKRLRLYLYGDDYVEAFTLLKDYIETYLFPNVRMVTDMGEFLIQINETEAKELFFRLPEEDDKGEDSQAIESKGYYDSDTSDNIMEQVKLTSQFIASERGLDYLTQLLDEIQKVSRDEIRFSHRFAGTRLPIRLN